MLIHPRPRDNSNFPFDLSILALSIPLALFSLLRCLCTVQALGLQITGELQIMRSGCFGSSGTDGERGTVTDQLCDVHWPNAPSCAGDDDLRFLSLLRSEDNRVYNNTKLRGSIWKLPGPEDQTREECTFLDWPWLSGRRCVLISIWVKEVSPPRHVAGCPSHD